MTHSRRFKGGSRQFLACSGGTILGYERFVAGCLLAGDRLKRGQKQLFLFVISRQVIDKRRFTDAADRNVGSDQQSSVFIQIIIKRFNRHVHILKGTNAVFWNRNIDWKAVRQFANAILAHGNMLDVAVAGKFERITVCFRGLSPVPRTKLSV